MEKIQLPLGIGPTTFIGVFLAALVVFRWIYSELTSPLRRIPGPFLARYSRLWLLYQYMGGQHHKTNIELHRKYGPIVRIAPNQYSIDDPVAAKIIYGSGSHFLKDEWYIPWGHPSFKNLFNEIDPAKHAAMRRQVSSLYSMSSLVSYEPYVDQAITSLCDRLYEFARTGSVLDMRHWFQCYAFDVIGLITFSKSFGFLETGKDVAGLMASLDRLSAFSSGIGVFSSWYPIIFKMVTRWNVASKTPQGPEYVTQFASSQIESRKHGSPSPLVNGPEDFIGKVLSRRSQGDHNGITNDILRIIGSGNVAAGSDTTGISLSAVLHHLCQNPEVMRKLQAELDEHFGSGTNADSFTYATTLSLPYFQAVVKEALRMHPATGYTMPRVVPQHGVELAGQFFPAGTIVGINAWVAHRNKSVFGEDADFFRPERWLEVTDEGRKKAMDSYFLAFGLGSRTCIGKNISLLEISKCIPSILQRFNFTAVEAGELHSRNHWFVKPQSFECCVTERAS